MTGSALEMRVKLDRLRRHHSLAAPTPVTVPLSAPTERAQVLTGRATTTTIDLQRQCFRGWCFGAIHRCTYPLYFKHITGSGKDVGTIDRLDYDAHGAVIVTATVTDPTARRAGAFSIGVSVRRFQIQNEASPEYFALITEAVIDEISLTDVPANPACLVSSRRDVCAAAQVFSNAADATRLMAKMLTIIQRGNINVVSPG